MEQKEFGNARQSLYTPAFFVLILWFIHIIQWLGGFSLHFLGILPRHVFGLPGLVTGPLVHADFEHLFSNSVPLLLLGAGVIYFYRPLALKILSLIYFLTNFSVWIGARSSYHIGASGIIYGLAAFLFFSGVVRKQRQLLGLSFLVIFVYGSMVWGVLPGQSGVSWEAHLFGGIIGTVLAFYYRYEGPQRKRYEWEIEDPEADKTYEQSIRDLEKGNRGRGKIRYIYKNREQ